MKTRLFCAIVVATAALLLSTVGDAANPKYGETEVTNGGSISGKVVWEGPAANVPPMAINKNTESCDASGSGMRESERLLVSKSGGVANAVVYIEAIAEGKAVGREDLIINQQGCRYIPHITIAPKKSKITLKSSDDILHNIHMFGAASYNIPFPDKNSIAKLFRKSGIVRLQCDAGHGWMSSYVHVVEHPYYVVSDTEGNFELTDVPPGEYTLKMWHEDWVVVNKMMKDGEVAGYEFGEPIEKTLNVTVTAGEQAKVQFSISK